MTIKGKDIADELQQIIPGAAWPGHVPLGDAPAGYFEALPGVILQKVRAAEVQEELEALSPLLAAAPRKLPLTVPDGYFQGLDAAAIAVNDPAPAPKVVPMRPRRNYARWAVAACLAGLAAISALMLLRSRPAAESVEAQLASVSDQAIEDYLLAHTDAFDRETIYNLVSDNGDEVLPAVPATDDLPAEAIERYLENTSLLQESSN